MYNLHKITTCFQILLCSSTKIYYKNNCHNSAKTICTLYKIRAQQQWIENKFLLSLVTYTRQFHKIICYCIKFLCHNHLQNTAIQTSQELQQKLVLQVMSKTDYKKSIWAYTATIIIIISPIVDTKPKISTLSIRIIRITIHYLKYFESKSIFTDYYTIAPVFNTRSIIHGNTKWEQISFFFRL